LIAAGAERLVARPGQNDDADMLVPTGLLKRRDELLDGLRTEGIVLFGPIDGDPGDAFAPLFVEDVAEPGHYVTPKVMCSPIF
jgi:hypothetical protein